MDPLLLEALRFFLAILAGGLVAVIAQRLAFRDARRLSLEERQVAEEAARRRKDEADAAIQRALMTEMREILDATDGPDLARLSILQRTAWDEASRLELPREIRRLIRDAYRLAEQFNFQIDVVEAREGNQSVNSTRPEREAAQAIAEDVHEAFEKALAQLEPERRRVGERR